jgi:ATP phosphoribosyltransferase
MSELRIAVPRGALFGDTLDLLDELGIDTAEVRANDRKLLFEDAGLITMRPSDVPTYVAAGAADIGITGKDVLMEQADRPVYELLDLEQTGRQAEIVEVKGSVELAPLTGLAEAIVDLTATGTTLRENGLIVREEIAVATARLIANPVAHKLRAAAIDDLLGRIRAR